ncbi:MAG: hypothetical protein II656_00020, partial [Ruminococcus sp.]|nr:hypothetical protein [Ruminococcus sp.]
MKLKKTAPFILALTMCTSVPVIYANAAEKTQNDVKLVVSTDKKVYDENDNIIAEVRLENNSDSDIIDVSIDSIIPEGYHLSDDSKSVLRSTYIMSGDSINSELVLISDNKKTNETTTTAVTTVSSTTKSSSTTVTTSKSTSAENTETSTTSIKADKDDSNDDKDSGSKVAVAAVIGAVLLAAGGAVVIFKKKGKGKNLMILLCLTAAGSFCTVQDAKADELDVYTFSVTEAVNVADKKIDITATVKFSIDKADMQSAVEEYYSDNSEEIVSVEAAAETSKVYSEKEAIKLLAERGFSDFPLTYDYDMNGTYMDEKEASAESDEKHPMYQTYFVSEDGSIWTVFIVGKSIIANPASYNLESDIDAQV